VRTAPLSLLAVLGAAACASGGARVASRELVGGTTLAVAPALTALPAGSSFAWVAPTSLLGRATAVDDARSDDVGMPGLREDVSTVLRGHGWREGTPDAAEYRLTIALVERLDPRFDPTLNGGRAASVALPRCTGAVGERREVSCTNRTPASSVAHGQRVERYGRWLAFVIERRADGAHFVSTRSLVWDWKPGDVEFVRPTLDLLLATTK
jgi:hypothetical protein